MTDTKDRVPPPVDYTATGWRSLREAMDAYASEQFGSGGVVAWTDFNPNNPGSLLFDVMAQVGEMLMYTLNAHAREQVIATLLRPQSFLNAAKAYDYVLRPADQSTCTVQITSDPGKIPYTLPATFQVNNSAPQNPVYFQPIADTQITEIVQNIPFIEGRQVTNELIGTSTGAPFQRFKVASSQVIYSTLQVIVGGVLWKEARNYSDLGSADQAYLLELDESGYTLIKFGDGLNGKVPANNSVIQCTYKTGGGPQGQVGVATLNNVVTPITGVLSVTNITAGIGGNAAQTVADGQKMLPGTIATLNRAIAQGDYAIQALNVPGVAKAVELAGDFASKQVLLPIAPSGGGMPSTTLKNQVIAFFRNVKALTFRVVPQNPYYLPLKLSLDLFVKPTYRQQLVLSQVTQYLLNALSFDAMDFGATVRLQDLYDALREGTLGLDGVAYVNITQLTATAEPRIEYGQANTGTGVFQNLAVSQAAARREWLIEVMQTTPYTRFRVTEKVLGESASMADAILSDDKANYITNQFVGAELNPNTHQNTTFTVLSNTPSTISVAGGLQSVAITGEPYSINRVQPASGKVLQTTVTTVSPAGQTRLYVASSTNFEPGDRIRIAQGTQQETAVISGIGSGGVYLDLVVPLQNGYEAGAVIDAFWQSQDGTLSFALAQGLVSFVVGDKWFIDTYAYLNDIEPRATDIPILTETNLAIRVVGGLSS
jgi:hypothetical protein